MMNPGSAISLTATANSPIGWAGSSLIDGVLSALGGAFVDAARSISSATVSALTATTTVDLSAEWFRRNVAVIAAVTLPALVGLFAVQVATAVLRRDPGGLGRAVLDVGKATVGSALALALTQAGLVATDQVCAAIAGASGTTVELAAIRFLQLTWLAGTQAGPVLQMALSALLIGGSLALWTVLLFRKAALVVVAVFAPVAFAGSRWSWTRRWIEAVAALVLCKIVIVVVFVVGASAFSQTGPVTTTSSTSGSGSGSTVAQGVSDLLVGLLLLAMAIGSPWVTWRFLHWAGIEAGVALTTAVGASPIPATARAAGQQARFTAQWALTQGAFKAAGAGASGMPGRRGAPPSGPAGRPGGRGGSSPSGSSGPSRSPAPSNPPRPSGPAGQSRHSGSGGPAAQGGWVPPTTRVRRGRP